MIDNLIGFRYQLHDLLGVGSMGAVYRATDRLTQSVIALKQVTASLANLGLVPTSPTPYQTSLNLALANEFQTLASLHHPNIIDVLDYGFHQTGPYFTMEYLPHARTILEAGQALPLLGRVDLLIQMLRALVYLHRHSIVHRDLKPANILVYNGTLKVLDFGLSVQREHAAEFAGTLAYVAPEVLAGRPGTAAADLYAVGVLAYELFAGHHPFPTEDSSDLIRAVMHQPPDLTALRFKPSITDTMTEFPSTLGAAMTEIVGRLLAKNPEERYPSAQAVIGALGQALERPDLTQESADVRESFLKAARFVGRSDERGQLLAALNDALAGHGSMWLVAGESGIGKSRLLEELRIPALVRGALVLTGQGVPGGGQLYQFWRAPLRRLALTTPLSDLDAGVLAAIVPDIARLLERPVPPAPSLESRDARERLTDTIVKMCRAQTQPVVLLLDDLQWARESLLPLRKLVRVIHDLPLLVVGSFRDEERPEIPGELPGAGLIKLDRFPADQIAELSVSMLGDTGRQPRIVAFLERETEGNAFFMVETLRTLAEEVQQLDSVTQAELPEHLFPKGVQAIAQRRLALVPLDDHPLLRIAAVAGREIDLNVLRRIDPAVNLERWLLVSSEAGLIANANGQWQFAHNKLRDGILSGLAEDQPPKLHRMVAEALEALYPDDETLTLRLAFHWHAAGDILKEIHYSRLAGQQMMAVCNYQEALTLFDRALILAGADTDTDTLPIHRAEVLYSTGDYHAAENVLQTVLPAIRLCGDPALAALATRILGNIMQVSGEYHQARALMQESFALSQIAREPLSEATAIRNLGLIAENLGELDEAVSLYARSLDLFRAIGNQLGTAGALANLGSVAAVRARYAEAQIRFEEALALFQAIGYRWGYAYTLMRLGEVAHRTGDYSRAKTALLESLYICAEIGHRWGLAYAQIQLGHVAHAEHRHAESYQHFIQALHAAREINATPTILDALTGTVLFLIYDEDFERAAERLSLILSHPATEHDTRQRAQQLFNALADELDMDTLHAASGGAHLDLNTVIDTLLADVQAA